MITKERIQVFKQIGSDLSQRRKEINVSLKEAENATSIRMSYLQAIEEGAVHKLISPVYAQGFVKQYATYLGVDGEKILREHPDLFQRLDNQDFVYGIGTLEKRGTPVTHVKWFPNAVWIALFGGVLLVAWFAARYFEVF